MFRKNYIQLTRQVSGSKTGAENVEIQVWLGHLVTRLHASTRARTHIKLRFCVCHEGIQDSCSIAPLISNPGTKWRGWMVNFTSRPFCLRKRGSSGRGTTGRTDGLHALQKCWISYSCGESNHDSSELQPVAKSLLRCCSYMHDTELAVQYRWERWLGFDTTEETDVAHALRPSGPVTKEPYYLSEWEFRNSLQETWRIWPDYCEQKETASVVKAEALFRSISQTSPTVCLKGDLQTSYNRGHESSLPTDLGGRGVRTLDQTVIHSMTLPFFLPLWNSSLRRTQDVPTRREPRECAATRIRTGPYFLMIIPHCTRMMTLS
jgi:hypothetical protein